MKKPWRSRLRSYRLKREKDQPLDEAIYLSVATGRLEPVLRALAIYPVYSDGKVSTDGDCQFLIAYSTHLRADSSRKVEGALLTEHIARLEHLDGRNLGAIFNPGGSFEITLEAHNVPRLKPLMAGIPNEDALTPIASESLEVSPACEDHVQLAGRASSQVPVPDGSSLRALTVSFNGFKPGTWPAVFLTDTLGRPQPFPTPIREQLERDFPLAILVDPAVPDWRRDLFWRYRDLLA